MKVRRKYVKNKARELRIKIVFFLKQVTKFQKETLKSHQNVINNNVK